MVIPVIKECWLNRKKILVMAKMQFKLQYNQTNLNLFWTVINPTVQAITYWIVFNIGMKVASPMDGVPYVAWMLTGLIPWLFISSALISSAGSIVSNRSIILNMKYPVSTIPVACICTEIITHLISLFILIMVQIFCGIQYNINIFYIFYFMFCIWILLCGYALLASALTVLIRDVQRIIQAFMRMLFFFMPITWIAPDNSILEAIMKWNPFSYIISGYRGAMLYQGNFDITLGQHILFWSLTILLMIFGCTVHSLLRPKFADYL